MWLYKKEAYNSRLTKIYTRCSEMCYSNSITNSREPDMSTILKNCDPKVLLAAVDRLEERYKKYYEHFKKIVIKENSEYRKNFWSKSVLKRTPEDALKYGMTISKNIETEKHFQNFFGIVKLFRIDMNIAIACNALVDLHINEDEIGHYITDEDFSPADLKVN